MKWDEVFSRNHTDDVARICDVAIVKSGPEEAHIIHQLPLPHLCFRGQMFVTRMASATASPTT